MSERARRLGSRVVIDRATIRNSASDHSHSSITVGTFLAKVNTIRIELVGSLADVQRFRFRQSSAAPRPDQEVPQAQSIFRGGTEIDVRVGHESEMLCRGGSCGSG